MGMSGITKIHPKYFWLEGLTQFVIVPPKIFLARRTYPIRHRCNYGLDKINFGTQYTSFIVPQNFFGYMAFVKIIFGNLIFGNLIFGNLIFFLEGFPHFVIRPHTRLFLRRVSSFRYKTSY